MLDCDFHILAENSYRKHLVPPPDLNLNRIRQVLGSAITCHTTTTFENSRTIKMEEEDHSMGNSASQQLIQIHAALFQSEAERDEAMVNSDAPPVFRIVAVSDSGVADLNTSQTSRGSSGYTNSFVDEVEVTRLNSRPVNRALFNTSSFRRTDDWDYLPFQTPPPNAIPDRSLSVMGTAGGSAAYVPTTEEVMRRRYYNAPVTPFPRGAPRAGTSSIDALLGLATLGDEVNTPLSYIAADPERAKLVGVLEAERLAKRRIEKESKVLNGVHAEVDESYEGIFGVASRKIFPKTNARKLTKRSFKAIESPTLSFEEKRALRVVPTSRPSSRASSFARSFNSGDDVEMGGAVDYNDLAARLGPAFSNAGRMNGAGEEEDEVATEAASSFYSDGPMEGVEDQDDIATEHAPSPRSERGMDRAEGQENVIADPATSFNHSMMEVVEDQDEITTEHAPSPSAQIRPSGSLLQHTAPAQPSSPPSITIVMDKLTVAPDVEMGGTDDNDPEAGSSPPPVEMDGTSDQERDLSPSRAATEPASSPPPRRLIKRPILNRVSSGSGSRPSIGGLRLPSYNIPGPPTSMSGTMMRTRSFAAIKAAPTSPSPTPSSNKRSFSDSNANANDEEASGTNLQRAREWRESRERWAKRGRTGSSPLAREMGREA